jgi:hypothetical protein
MANSMSRRTVCNKLSAAVAGFTVSVYGSKAYAAPTSVDLQCVTNDVGPVRHFAISFKPATNGWTESEPGGTSDIFRTKSGNYVTVANTTSPKKNDTVIAVLPNFNPSTASEGDTGNSGKALETARTFEWKVDIVIP